MPMDNRTFGTFSNKRWKGYMLFHFALHSNILHVCNLFFGFTLAFHEHSIMTLYMYKADKKALYIDEFASSGLYCKHWLRYMTLYIVLG